MKTRALLFATLALLTPGLALADNVGGCGVGSKLFDGKKGQVYEILAVTFNGSSGNQTFGISSGTSGCETGGVVRSNWKTAAYIDGNMNNLARDMSRGEGESLVGLASVLQIPTSEHAAFANVLQGRFGEIFASSETSSDDVAAALRNVLASDAAFAQYAANV